MPRQAGGSRAPRRTEPSVPDALVAAMAEPGLPWLMAAMGLAGLVFGFAGFGAALVFQPLASSLVAPATAAAMLSVASLGGAVVVFPRALRGADHRQVAWMLGFAVPFLWAGALVLVHAPEAPLRWAISAVVAVTLVALVAGWRRRLVPRPATLAAIGAAAGTVGGATGLHGPVVILFTLTGRDPAEVMRATLVLVLTGLGIALLPVLWLHGHLDGAVLWLGALSAPAYMLGTAAGQALFDPGRARLWRVAGQAVIAAALVAGLPFWS